MIFATSIDLPPSRLVSAPIGCPVGQRVGRMALRYTAGSEVAQTPHPSTSRLRRDQTLSNIRWLFRILRSWHHVAACWDIEQNSLYRQFRYQLPVSLTILTDGHGAVSPTAFNLSAKPRDISCLLFLSKI